MSRAAARRADASGGLTAVVASVLMLAAACTLGGCGRSDDSAERIAVARGYATAVGASTEQARTQIAGVVAGADYRDSASAAASTRGYATAIRAAAGRLAEAAPPASVAARHRALVALYRSTADGLDALAAQFAAARGTDALAALAQRLSAQVQAYSTQEQALRTAIQDRLAATVVTTPPAATPAASTGTAQPAPAPD